MYSVDTGKKNCKKNKSSSGDYKISRGEAPYLSQTDCLMTSRRSCCSSVVSGLHWERSAVWELLL